MPKKVKICGMKYRDNLREIVSLKPDFLGFIFYEKSPRFVGNELNEADFLAIPKTINKIGVFVNAPINELIETAQKFQLDMVQLHGNENPAYCRELKEKDFSIIKAFRADKQLTNAQIEKYEDTVDYFLFDSPGKHYGGNSITFNWEMLEQFNLQKPFFLSGGLGLENIAELKSLYHPYLVAYDANSKLETAPGLKDVEKVRKFLREMREE